MSKMKLFVPALACLLVMSACAQEEPVTQPVEPIVKTKKVAETRHHEPHPYGGWYCPDNLGGFPPVNIQELDAVPVVQDRLPTKEEANSGISLMYFDLKEYPEAKALDIELPQVATVYSERTETEELIIVIQAVTIGPDTIVGYRFPNGGNGSAWYDQVTFLSKNDVAAFGDSPFVFEKIQIAGDRKQIWRALTTTSYARNLGKRFGEEEFFKSEWNNSMKRLNYETIGERADGIVAMVFGNLYMHIDYQLNGVHYSEKMLILENSDNKTSDLYLVAGPFHRDYEKSLQDWQNTAAQVKAWCEGN